MKNQYVGDIGDYGKYSLLRAFSEAGIRVGVNWYLTENDDSNDGKFTSYLQKGDLRCKDPVVFDALKKIAHKAGKSVKDIQRSGIIKNALFYDKKLDGKGTPSERDRKRNKWLFESMEELSDAELIFMDPDNGLLESNDASKLGAEKYVIPDEVELYFNAGHNVVYYCHKGRRTDDAWLKYKNTMFERIPSAKPAIITFHKGSQRSYVFLIHEKDFVKYRKIIDCFMRGWSGIFSEEYISKGDNLMKDDPEYYYREVKMRKLIRIDRETGEREEVTVTNRNNLPDNEHLRLLNLNDVKYLYEETD